MSEKELELLELVRGHTDPEEALLIAVQVITSFLDQHG
jgi:hypothetical protein